MKSLTLDGLSLTVEDLYRYSTVPATVTFAPSARRRLSASRALVDTWIRKNEAVYGITTGFGEFSNVRINEAHLEQLQDNLIMSHAAGAGEPLPPVVARAMMILRMNTLLQGFSGIRPSTLEALKAAFNAGIVPVIPSRGSVGCSGDLVQLAHLVLALMGKGKVFEGTTEVDSALVLKRAGLKPIRLAAKEGLALINGTQMMTAFGALAVHEARQLSVTADIAAAMTVEALHGSDTPFDPRIHRLRPHPGQALSAANLRTLLRGSEIREFHRHDDPRVQDAYSIRCIPQVHGAARDAIDYAYRVISTEINSVTDNPLIFPNDGAHLEGGNFHGEPVALALDFLAIALSELASISERRIERMVNGALSGLPRFLTENGGLNSGLMIAQYTAASLVSENKVLSHPASVDSIPTSANQEDHNSMGSIGALKVWQVLQNARTVLAIELMVAAQGIDFSCIHPGDKHQMRPGEGVRAAHRLIRKYVRHLYDDRVLHTDISAMTDLLRRNLVREEVERRIGRLR